MNLLHLIALLCWLSFATADGNIEVCASATCANAPQEEEEQEDVNDADFTMHMQMRVGLDIPLAAQSAEVPTATAQVSSDHAAKGHEEAHKVAKLPLASLTPVAGLSLLEQDSSVEHSPPLPGASVQTQADAQAFYSGSYLLLGTGLGALLVIVGAMGALALRGFFFDRKGRSQDEVRAAAKAWLLEWALGYEKEETVEEELKVRKKQPPLAIASDDGHSTDEEEPEAESDSTELVDIMEDAVYVAQQVEVANEAVDKGYDLDRKERLIDTIRCDFR